MSKLLFFIGIVLLPLKIVFPWQEEGDSSWFLGCSLLNEILKSKLATNPEPLKLDRLEHIGRALSRQTKTGLSTSLDGHLCGNTKTVNDLSFISSA